VKKILLVTDLDGTLVTSGVDYGRAIHLWVSAFMERFAHQIPHYVGYDRAVSLWALAFMDEFVHQCPHYDDVTKFFLESLERNERDRYFVIGVQRDRFAGSMVLAYQDLCKHFHLEFSEAFARRTFEIGWGFGEISIIPLLSESGNDITTFFLDSMKRLDKERYPKMRAHRDRFPGSMVLAYRQLCEHFHLEVSEEFARRTFEIGLAFFDEEAYRKRTMIPGAAEMLSFLRNPDVEAALYCVTAGDMRVQWAKWRGYNLKRFFPTIAEFRVVKWEKEEILKRLRKLYPYRDAYMVGDSIGSSKNGSGDLWPAYRADFIPIYVAHPSDWDNGDHIDELPPGTISLDKIQKIPSAIYQLPLL